MSKGRRRFFLAVFVVWTVLTLQWTDAGCDYPEAYLAVVRFGTPEGPEFLPACAGERCSYAHEHRTRTAHASHARTPRNDPTIEV